MAVSFYKLVSHYCEEFDFIYFVNYTFIKFELKFCLNRTRRMLHNL